ncbi:MAG: copper amine oxidase N-terminal domain-containing protein, partial [Clostridiales bacterium]|nr:copper amine oxidase N-terminal domain-containing protein [Clostridiales bacterium]
SGAGGTLNFTIGAPSYVVGNQAFIAESPAFIENGRTFLGVRDIGNAINGQIEWDQATQTATVSKDNIVVKITVGASNIAITKSGVTAEEAIDAPAQNRAGRVYLPFRALLEAFGYSVEWDQATQAIICTV